MVMNLQVNQTNGSFGSTAITSYADVVNTQFHKSESHYVNLNDRLTSSLNATWKKSILDDAVENFKLNNPNVKYWEQFSFCRAVTVTLDLIDIDITLQRMLDVIHCCNILDRFKALMAMPICVYEDSSRPGRYICWDGQHTAMVLFIIATRVLKLDISQIQIPIVIYASDQKSEMRECFITLNGPEGKKSLDHIDKVHQKIFGVRTDGSRNPDWMLIELKQQALEDNKIFLTHEKFGDTGESGAYSRLEEFIDDDKYNLEITQNFAKYFFKICQSNRPVQPKESWMLYDFFKLCQNSNIKVDDAYIYGVANSLKQVSNGDFDAGALYNRAKASYQEWWRDNKPWQDGTISGISYSEKRIGMTFLLAQIAKNFKGEMPKYYPHWEIPKGDLF